TREKAQADLAKIGLEAFDALNEAQHHDDVEIALRARYLVRAMQVQWHQDSDSAEVIRILTKYGEQSETARRSRIDLLKGLASRQGLVALCRLARFETSEELSKHAALKVLDLLPELKDEAAREDAGRKIIAGSGNGKRTATAWLRTFAKSLPDIAASIPAWEAHVKAEHELFTQFPDRTSREVVRDLYRFEVALLQGLGREQEAVAVMRKTLSLLEGTEQQLAELMDWLLERKAWPVVQEVAERFPKPFLASAELLYRLAEAQEADGKMDAAKQTAAKALGLRPDDTEGHFRLSFKLQERGQFTFAENELRNLLPRVAEDAHHQFRVPYALSEMLHDIGRELPAAEVSKGAVDMLAKNAQPVENSVRPQGAWISRMHYFYALDLLEKGKLDEARKHLDDGAAADPTDADVLIALNRWPNPTPEQQASIRKLVTAATEGFEKDMEKFKQAGDTLDENDKADYATACNQFAWLVGNTFGDFEKAVRVSHKSVDLQLELRRDPGAYYDTLGRCYYAQGDFENAIKYQMQALELQPHSGQMKRQLALFQKAQGEKK
ncbi:MAG: tetratricopeptide repeat protein, partial [Pirellulaceae bacterium]|nr:tetratricopeptide repeat protein [Pirellulaceae bacterium]